MNTIGTLTTGHGAVVTIVKKRDVGYQLMPNYKPSQALILGELFCGPGGIAIGAEIANKKLKKFSNIQIHHGWAVDYHQDTTNTYLNNVSNATTNSVICDDVRNVNVEQLAKISIIDGFAYGFPCNDFSLVGEQKGMDGSFGPLYSYGIPILEKFNPKFYFNHRKETP